MSPGVTYCFVVTVTLTSGFNYRKIVSRAFLILFEVGIPPLVFGPTLRSWSVTYCFQVTLTTSGLSSSKIVSVAYLLYYLGQESQIVSVPTLTGPGVPYTVFGSL